MLIILKLGGIGVLQGLGVPSFFVISSYLFFSKCYKQGLEHCGAAYLKFVKRLALVYLFYLALLSPVVVPGRGWFAAGFPDGLLLFLKDLLLRYSYPGSWFLSALVMATTIVFLLLRLRVSPWVAFVLFLLLNLYVINVDDLPQVWQLPYHWYEAHVRGAERSFPIALSWISMGACFALPSMKERLTKMRKYVPALWALFVAGFFLTYFKIEIDGLWTVIMVACLIVLFFNMDLKPSPIYIRLREYSILFFFWHFIVLQVYKVVFHGQHILQFGAWLYPMTLVPVFFIATLILWLENKRYFKWLKYSH